MTRWTVRTCCTPKRVGAKAEAALGPGVIYDRHTGRVHAVFEVEAATLRQATE